MKSQQCNCAPGRRKVADSSCQLCFGGDVSSCVSDNVFKYYKVVGLIGGGRASTIFLAKRKQFIAKKILGSLPGLQLNRKQSMSTSPLWLSSVDRENTAKSKRYALKYIQRNRHMEHLMDIWKSSDEELRNEVETLKRMQRHPNIVTMYESFTFDNRTFLVTEYCEGGNLYERVPYTETDSLHILSKVLSGVAHLHKHGIIHRDIKFENIVFDSYENNAEIKIIDFGLATSAAYEDSLVTGSVGTVETMAPEVFKGSYKRSADVWSVGVVAFMLLSGMKPFAGTTRAKIKEKILSGEFNFSDENWVNISCISKNTVSSLMQMKPASRPTAARAHEEILKVNEETRDDSHILVSM